jgi:hypothetical protein
MRGFLKVLGLLICVVLLPTGVFAQSAGASLAGVVKDTSGAVLPGVTVTVASEALIEKMRETVSDGTGQYRFVDLRPGTYTVTATLTGFNTFKRDNIELSGTGVFTIPVEMKVGAIEETVTVSGETPVVDLQSTVKERVMSKDVIAALPTGRMYNSLGVLIPSVNSSSRDVGGQLGDTMASLTAHGGSGGDQRVLQNGLNVMTLQTGGGNIGGMVPNTNAAQEVAIDTSAASAERQTGGVTVNFIPRDGGNTIRGSMFATGAYQSQQASNLTQALQDQGLVSLSNYKMNWDFNPGVGGPIMKDKLWYYYTYRNNGAQQYAAGMFYNQNEFLPNNYQRVPNPSRPGLAIHGDWWDSELRLTWQMDPKNKFAGTWDQQYYCRCPNGVSSTVSPEAGNDRRFPTQQLLHGEWWSPLTSKILIEFVALHRTERWGNMDLRPTDQGGSLNVTPAQYALYPQMIGVTQTAGDSIPSVVFHGPSAIFNNNWVPNYTYRWAVSYITGAHAFKVGGQDSFGYILQNNYIPTLDPGSASEGGIQRPVRYTFSTTNTPSSVTVFQTPYTTKVDQNHDMGLFVQDRWTLDRLTLTGGVRYDWNTGEIPGQDLAASTLGRPAIHFDGIQHANNYMDWTPRAAAAYDLFGDGKTAVKVSLNKYVAGLTANGIAAGANPIGRLTNSASRNWTDTNGNFIVDCDLTNAAVNGECTNAGSPPTAAQIAGGCPAASTALNCLVPTALVDQGIRANADGGALWNTRGYNWEFSAGVQRELIPRVSLDVSYFRRWFGNFTVTKNTSVTPADFRSFDIVAPVDARLPGGGGYPVTGFVDFNNLTAAKATAVNAVQLTDSLGANQIQHWNGVDVNINARLQNGLLLQGGTSTGRTYNNTCDVVALAPETLGNNPASFCQSTEPWLTQVKAVAAYTLPRYAQLPATLALVLENVQMAGTFQSIPGGAMQATYTMSAQNTYSGTGKPQNPLGNELNDPALSTLAGLTCTGGAAPGLCNGSSKSVNLLAPTQVYDDRQNQLDLRVGKILRFGRTRTSLNFDIFNVTNANTVLSRNNAIARNLGFASTANNAAIVQTPAVGAVNQAPQGVLVGGFNTSNTLWTPTSVLQARFYKISATFDF